MTELDWLSAFVIGVLGGVHCAGMCGGIVGALTFGLPEEQRHGARLWQFQLAYNLGRISSYVVAGAIVGGLGFYIASLVSVQYAQNALLILAGLFMFLMGLYLAQWSNVLSKVEQAGGIVWKVIEPAGRKLMPVKTPGQGMALGAIWGWLPCGLVYSVLVWTISAGGALEGALLMLAFGLGTLPNLLLMGAAANTLQQLVRQLWVRRTAGLLVSLYGVYLIYGAL